MRQGCPCHRLSRRRERTSSVDATAGLKGRSVELLAPVGGFEQLEAALAFGADAVYLATTRFGMRAKASNFTLEELPQVVERAHGQGVAVHLACNTLMMQEDIRALPAFLEQVQAAGVDALIISDMGAFALAKEYAPACQLHVSTQASVANAEAAKLWHSLGASRIVCAREMTLADIAAMRKAVPESLQIEAFVHGAQCMAVSGRCLISSYLTGRSGNQGACTQPCRWSYTLEEEKRPGVHFPIEEDGRGTFIMNAKDLNMAAHLRDLAEAGVDSIKIEGRNKKAFYVACVVAAYRRALDEGYSFEVERELLGISHRPYGTGFYFGEAEQAADFDGYEQETMHVADVVASPSARPGRICVRCRNRFAEGDVLEVLAPHQSVRQIAVKGLCWHPESDGDEPATQPQPVPVANRSCQIYSFECDDVPCPGSFLRTRTYRRSARH